MAFNKNYISDQAQLDKIPINSRHLYYLSDDFVATASGEDNGEPLIEVDGLGLSFLIKPIWQDEVVQVDDQELQHLLDMEGAAFRNYIATHPNFKMRLRKTTINKLEQAQKLLPKNLKLVLKAGYRPISVQRQLFRQFLDYFASLYPDKSEKELYLLNLEFIADPDNYIPPHSTGGAVDVYLFDTNFNKEVDMGSPINYPDDRSWTYNDASLTSEQKANRNLLTMTMLKAGFANLPSEWWHYSYGDQYWAKFYDQKYVYSKCEIED